MTFETTTTTRTVHLPGVGDVPVRVDERGTGRPVLLLHGGAGPASVAGFADRLAADLPARVLTPTHPGFDATHRPEDLTSIRGLAQLYAALLDALDLTGVTVVGNSIGGWIAAELALLHPRRAAALVVVDAVGVEVPGHPVADVLTLTFPEIVQLSYADPAAFAVDPATLPEAAKALLGGNLATLARYGGEPSMTDPTLLGRLPGIDLPTLVVWGEADGIADPGYGRTFAAAIPGARFVVLPGAGHLPQLEAPQALLELVRQHAGAAPTPASQP